MLHKIYQIPPEVIPLVVNLAMLAAYIHRREPGKIFYWLGATLLTIGLLKMRG